MKFTYMEKWAKEADFSWKIVDKFSGSKVQMLFPESIIE